jgi:hypothetical protein
MDTNEWLDEHGNDWRFWKSAAEDLLKPSRISEHPSNIHALNAKLTSRRLVLDLLFMSWYLRRGGRVYENGKRRPEVRTQDMLRMSRRIEYPLDPKYHRMLKRLKKYARWTGPYPFPIDERSRIKGHWLRDFEDSQLLDALIESLLRELSFEGGV